ncbi:hypothetical protein Tco_1497446 [Tanacetum coccineum]
MTTFGPTLQPAEMTPGCEQILIRNFEGKNCVEPRRNFFIHCRPGCEHMANLGNEPGYKAIGKNCVEPRCNFFIHCRPGCEHMANLGNEPGYKAIGGKYRVFELRWLEEVIRRKPTSIVGILKFLKPSSPIPLTLSSNFDVHRC